MWPPPLNPCTSRSLADAGTLRMRPRLPATDRATHSVAGQSTAHAHAVALHPHAQGTPPLTPAPGLPRYATARPPRAPELASVRSPLQPRAACTWSHCRQDGAPHAPMRCSIW
ncbi:hypothetical protein GUJ93_ZPchr0012g20706 [Zizania palustris]|uniref:Uncharacterized protein n=1 Tax=Zizania palustris TaxID=103762 RepID=A0A8J6BWE1_ZIZPA|nr:hypothetical protein GUJ93_ZPchr0012g20706 [Zizania palustris]